MVNKKTQREFFEEIITLAKENGREDIVDFAKGRIEMLDKKKSGSKPTKTQEENVELMKIVLSVLDSNGATVTEIQNKDERLKEYNGVTISNQKISALLKKMCDEGVAIKTIDKKKSYFSLAE